MRSQRFVLDEVKSINDRVFRQAIQILRNEPSVGYVALGMSAKVATHFVTMDAQRVHVFDVAILEVSRSDDPEYWARLTMGTQPKMQRTLDWRLKAIGQTMLHYARDISRTDLKLCQCMLGVSRPVAEVFAHMSIERALEIPYETSDRLFSVREGNDAEFWGRVVGWPLSNISTARIINHQLKMRSFSRIVPRSKPLPPNFKKHEITASQNP